MTFLETLQAHRGGLLRLKTELYWYGGRGYDENPGRVCLLLDTAADALLAAAAPSQTSPLAAVAGSRTAAATYLLIDGSPHWVWVAEKDVELI